LDLVVTWWSYFILEDLSLATLSSCYLQREPNSGKTWFLAGSISSNEELVDVAVRELHEETGLILTHDDLLTLLSDAPVRIALPERQHLVYVYTASLRVPYVTARLRAPA
jgi:8-oxo-dGTP pyrophosphatase MutT (NUDIX family)